jgi:hypothetical protein
MITEPEARQLLIDSCHSLPEAGADLQSKTASAEFVSLLVRIALDEEDYGGDAPMQAAYYLSQAPSENVRPFEPQLLALLTTANGYGGHVALALGRMRSSQAQPVILSELDDGEFPSAWLYREALEHYGAPAA